MYMCARYCYNVFMPYLHFVSLPSSSLPSSHGINTIVYSLLCYRVVVVVCIKRQPCFNHHYACAFICVVVVLYFSFHLLLFILFLFEINMIMDRRPHQKPLGEYDLLLFTHIRHGRGHEHQQSSLKKNRKNASKEEFLISF